MFSPGQSLREHHVRRRKTAAGVYLQRRQGLLCLSDIRSYPFPRESVWTLSVISLSSVGWKTCPLSLSHLCLSELVLMALQCVEKNKVLSARDNGLLFSRRVSDVGG